jgi:hypothetical protein
MRNQPYHAGRANRAKANAPLVSNTHGVLVEPRFLGHCELTPAVELVAG